MRTSAPGPASSRALASHLFLGPSAPCPRLGAEVKRLREEERKNSAREAEAKMRLDWRRRCCCGGEEAEPKQ